MQNAQLILTGKKYDKFIKNDCIQKSLQWNVKKTKAIVFERGHKNSTRLLVIDVMLVYVILALSSRRIGREGSIPLTVKYHMQG